MNKEELLIREATLYCQEYATSDNYDSVYEAYIFSAESREKRIADLEKERETIKNVMYKFLNCMEQYYYPTEESLKIAKEFAYGKE